VLTVALVTMPFMTADRPSLQIGLLTAIAEEQGFAARAVHANVDFAARVGPEKYRKLVEHRGWLIGDWLFSVAAFGADAPDPDGRLLTDFAAELVAFGAFPGRVRRWLLDLRRRTVPEYLDSLVDNFDGDHTDVVGFSSSFQQNTASFAFAKRLKERFPNIITVFGGANFDGEMGPELVRSIECIDVAVVGEADDAFPRLLTAIERGEDPGGVPGVISRLSGRVVATAPARPVAGLERSPTPDFTDFFDRSRDLGLLTADGSRRTWLPVETARGCWWGAKQHCVFCGLNGTSMEFRSKPAEQVDREFATLSRRHGTFRFAAVDNIMDPRFLTTLWPALIEKHIDYEIFYEVKSNLGRDQLKLLAQAGVTRIQPGIESLSSAVLRRMRKGVTAAQNVNLLRWARYYRMDVSWNILWGFPGEEPADYRRQAELLPLLTHLEPPETEGRFWLERFSPLFAQAQTGKFARYAPERSYKYVYPAGTDLDKVAYFFDYKLAEPLPARTYRPMQKAIRSWQAAWKPGRPSLTYWYTPALLHVHDARKPGKQRGTHIFDGVAADVYVACSNRPRSAAAVGRELSPPVPAHEVRAIMAEFERLGLMLIDEEHALALALPAVTGR
jgi:ribosomal peptide maturation radical SAM protein 1